MESRVETKSYGSSKNTCCSITFIVSRHLFRETPNYPTVKIYIKNQQKDLRFTNCKKQVRLIVESVLQVENAKADELSLFFVSDRKMKQIHLEFFQDPSSTDCMSFPIDEPTSQEYCVLGEIFVCPLTAISFSQKRNKNPYIEATLYIVHGLLHLLGYDDQDTKSRRKMRQKERKCMKILESKGYLLS